MNQSEKRRKQLLESARALYAEDRTWPAIHPRYGNIYDNLYGEEKTSGSLAIRVILCCILFVVFVVMDDQNLQIAHVSSKEVTQTIEKEFAVSEVWENL